MKAQLIAFLPIIGLAVASPFLGSVMVTGATRRITDGGSDAGSAADAADSAKDAVHGAATRVGAEGARRVLTPLIDLGACSLTDLQDVDGCVGTCGLEDALSAFLGVGQFHRGIAPGLVCTFNKVDEVGGNPARRIQGHCNNNGECCDTLGTTCELQVPELS